MAELNGVDNYIEIKAFYGKTEEYKKVIDALVDGGHSFAVHGGNLYFSASGLGRLLKDGLLRGINDV